MSQNSQTLLLFFGNKDSYRNSLKMFKSLEAEKVSQASEAAQTLGSDISKTWNDDWFNHRVTSASNFIRLDYDTSTGYDLPLEVLETLFGADLRVACLEIFYDQVGEYGQYFFLKGNLVDNAAIYRKAPKIEAIVKEQFSADGEDLDDDGYERPSSIRDLIEWKDETDKESLEMVGAIRELAKQAYETGENPIEIVRSTMIVQEGTKAIAKGLGFGVVTVLLFKGIWLWITLSILLTFLLLSHAVATVNDEFDGENEEDSHDEDDD